MDSRFDWLISVDDHVIEPSHVWETRLPSRYRDIGPRLRTDESGEAWFFEGKRIATSGLSAAAGKDREEFSPLPITYEEMRPGCYDPKARVEDMNRAGVLASYLLPVVPARFCGQTFYEADDRELGLLCVQAYNDWMIDEWCGSAPGRLIPMIILPLWDAKLAAKEIDRTAALGARAIAFSENPYQLGTSFDPRSWRILGSLWLLLRRRRRCPSACTSARLLSCPDFPGYADGRDHRSVSGGEYLCRMHRLALQRLPAEASEVEALSLRRRNRMDSLCPGTL